MGDTWTPQYSDSDSSDDLVYITRDPTKDKHYDRKQELLWDCKGKVGKIGNGREPLVIAVIGPPGCGKSSFLNTVFAAFSNNHWEEHAKYGEFGSKDKQVSRRLKSFRKKDYYKDRDEYLMPTFLDMTGFEDDESDLNKELLNIVLCGKMAEGEKLKDVIEFEEQNGFRALQEKYFGQKYFGVIPEIKSRNILTEFLDLFLIPNRRDNHRVNKVLVVCSANPDTQLPEYFFEAVTDVTNRERDITVYGVLTKGDKYRSSNSRVKEKERAFMRALGIPRERYAKIKNYCPEVDSNMTYLDTIIPAIDVPVLRLMRQVLSEDRSNDDNEEITLKLRCKNAVSKFVPNLSDSFVQFIIFVFFAIIALLIYRLVPIFDR